MVYTCKKACKKTPEIKTNSPPVTKMAEAWLSMHSSMCMWLYYDGHQLHPVTCFRHYEENITLPETPPKKTKVKHKETTQKLNLSSS